MRNIHIILVLFGFFLLPNLQFAQIVTLKTDTVNVPCTSTDTFVIPVKVLNFNNLGGIQFTLEWDKTRMSYIFIQDFNAALTNGFVNMDTTTHLNKGQLTFAWLDPGGLTLPNSGNNTLFKVAFVRLGGSFSPLSFDTTALPNPPPTAITISDPNFVALPFELSTGGMKTTDNTPPTINCPSNVTVTSTGPIPVNNIAPVVADNCGIDHTGWASTGATSASFPNDPDASGTLFNVGQSQVVYTTTDVGGNTATCSFIVDVQFDPASGDTLTLLASSGTANCGDVFYTDISVLNFDSIFGIQFSLEWLTSVLQFDSVAVFNQDISVTSSNFNLSFAQNGNPPGSGNLSFGWNSDNFTAGSALVNGAVLFRVYFKAVGGDGAASAINFANLPAALLSIDPNLDPIYTKYISGLFLVDDIINPTIQCPQNQSINAVIGQTTAEVTGLDPLNLDDNCSGNIQLTYSPINAGSGNGNGPANGTYPGGTTTVTYTATDAAGNTSTCSFLVTVDLGEIFELKIDSVDFNCGSGATTVSIPFRVYNFDNIGGMNFRVSWDETVLTYNGFSNVFAGMGIAGANFPSSGTTAPQGFLNFLAVSPSGQWPNIPDGGVVFQLNFTVNINGSTGLIFEQPEGAIDGAFTAVPFDFIDGNFASIDATAPVVTCPVNQTAPGNANCTAVVNLTATATDACGTVVSLVNNAPAGNIFPAGATQVVFTATDDAGNIGFCSMTVTVNANTALQITNCPTAPIIISAVQACSAPISYPVLTATNPCIANANFVYNCNFLPGAIIPVGLTNVVCTATQLGNGGGFATCNFQVVVVDDGAPQLQCPQNITIDANGTSCYALNPVLPVPVISDNCDQNLVPFIDPDLIDTIYTGVNTLIYLATDNSGNAGACSFNVTVVEKQAPTAFCPEPVEVTAGANCQGVATWDAPAIDDNCTAIADLDVAIMGGASGDLFNVGETVVIYTVTDASGNSATCSLTVTVLETTPPTISGCPNSFFINLPVGTCDTVITWTMPQAADNCGIESFSSNYDPGSTFPSGVTTVIYTAVDLAGNTTTCSFIISAADKVSPFFVTFPNDVLVTNADPCGAILNIPEPTAGDNCDPDPVISYAGNLQDTFPIGITIIEILVTDASGNVTKDTLTITVQSMQVKSFINVPSNQNLMGCAQAATWITPNIQGFCEPPLVTITSDHQSGEIFPVGTTIVTYTATQSNQGSITASFTITVTDPDPPVFNCPQPVIVNAAGVVISDPSEIVQSVATADACQSANLVMDIPSATDNCTPTPVITQTAGPEPSGIYPIGSYTLAYEATDEYGNTSICSYTVVVAPFAITAVTASPNPGCEGELVTLSVTSVPGASFNWTGPKGPYQNAATISVTSLSQDQTGNYGVTASLNGCSADGGTVTVVMSTKPSANDDLSYLITAGETLEGTSILANDQFSLPTDITIAQQSPLIGLTLNPDGTFTYISETTGAFSFIYEICSIACPELCDMATVTINVSDINCDFVPNIFTPNGDLTNDFFEIPCLDSGLYPNNTLVIYSQWGDKVFEAKGYANTPDKAWNGTLNNEAGKNLPDGVYYYIFQQDANVAALKGFVHIYR